MAAFFGLNQLGYGPATENFALAPALEALVFANVKLQKAGQDSDLPLHGSKPGLMPRYTPPTQAKQKLSNY